MHDLDWLTEQRPETVVPDEAATARARNALLAHMEERVELRRAPRRRRPRAGVLALAAVVLIAGVVAAGALPGGDGPARLGAPVAVAAPLVRLSERIQDQPAPPGDATLVLREHAFPDRSDDFTGADLYLDDGRYYYALTRAELRGAAQQERQGQRQIAAAKAAIDLPADAARKRMIAATWAPGATSAPAPLPPVLRKRLPGPTPTPAPQRTLDDNRVWMGSMDALIAGAGRADVRAGVMKLLATMPAVKVEPGDGVLVLRNTDFPDGYEEALTVDDRTGVIQRMTGGNAGKPPSVVVDYEIRRVEARDIIR